MERRQTKNNSGIIIIFIFLLLSVTESFTDEGAMNNYRIIFDKNAETAEEIMEELSVKSGTVIKLPACSFKNNGFKFAGWALKPEGKVVYNVLVQREMDKQGC
jgi:hypothetical protein